MRISSLQTKTSSRRGSPNRRRLALVLLTALCGFVLLVSVRGGVGTAASLLFSPVVFVKTWFWESSGRLPLYFRTQRALIASIQSLQTELESRDDDAFTIRQLEIESTELHRLLGMHETGRIVARVLVRPNQTPYDTLVIDQGSEDGVVENAIVYTEGTIAIGTIAKTYAHSSLVRLVSSPGLVISAYIFGPNVFVEAEGMGGGVLRLAVPQGIPLAVGNLVVLPAAGAGTYGEVVTISAEESDPQQYGYVTSPVPLQALRFVSIAREALPSISYQTALEVVASASSTLFSIDIPDDILIGTTTATTSVERVEVAE